MGIRAVPSQPVPEPKATCPSCHRPVVLLKAAACLYCGGTIPGALSLVPKPAMPPELMFALEPRAGQTVSTRTKWIRRILALGATAVLIALFMGACMNR